MADNRYNEDEEARKRIDAIRRGAQGGSQQAGDAGRGPAEELEADNLGEADAVSNARSRAASARSTLRGDSSRAGAVPPSRTGGSDSGGVKARQDDTSSGRSNQALFIIGGVVLVGILVVALIFALSQLNGGSGGPIIAFGPSATPTATATETPTPTPTATATPTPTLVAPASLDLPPLTCLFTGTDCNQYCANSSNTSECNQARDFIEAQDADPDFWFACLADEAGPNSGNDYACLQDAWRANQGAFDTVSAETPSPIPAAQ